MQILTDSQNPISLIEGLRTLPQQTSEESSSQAVRDSFGEILEKEISKRETLPRMFTDSRTKPNHSEFGSILASAPEPTSPRSHSEAGAQETKPGLTSESISQTTSPEKTVSDPHANQTEENAESTAESLSPEEESLLDEEALDYSINLLSRREERLPKPQTKIEPSHGYEGKMGKPEPQTVFMADSEKLTKELFAAWESKETKEKQNILSGFGVSSNKGSTNGKQEAKSDSFQGSVEKTIPKEELKLAGIANHNFTTEQTKQNQKQKKRLTNEVLVSKNKSLQDQSKITEDVKDKSVFSSNAKLLRVSEFVEKKETRVQSSSEKIKGNSLQDPPNSSSFAMPLKLENTESHTGDRQNSFGQGNSSLFAKSIETQTLSSENKPKLTETNIKQNINELVKQARFEIVQNGRSSVEIIMDPKEFGRLHLKVMVEGDKVEGRILVESEDVKLALLNEIQTLKENLKEQGLELQNLLVDVWDNGSHFSENSQRQELYDSMVSAARNRNQTNGKSADSEEDFLEARNREVTSSSQSVEFFV